MNHWNLWSLLKTFALLTVLFSILSTPEGDETVRGERIPVDELKVLNGVSTEHSTGAPEDNSHPCLRDCEQSNASLICHYNFKVEWYIIMSKACFDCPINPLDCARPHCVYADGYERPIVTVNRQMPGPTIQVCMGDEVVVDVMNELGSDSTTIHWHGLHQHGTPYMDGVPFVTQCPIQAGTSFRYHFLADIGGTHYWHSHSAMQRSDGLFGAFIVREQQDPQRYLYDEDNPDHVLVLTDWLEALAVDKFLNHHHTEHDNKPYNILINGRGKWKFLEKDGQVAHTPLHEMRVQKDLRYRVRVLSNSIQNCPMEVSIDKHKLLMIATDGQPIEPVTVDSFVIYAGERWDFVVHANEMVDTYWIKIRGLLDCDSRFKSAHQVAVLRYDGADGLPSPFEKITYNDTVRDGLQLNKLNAAPGDGTFLTAAEIHSLKPMAGIDGIPDYQFWLSFDFNGKDNHLFHNEQHYPFQKVPQPLRLYIPQLNDISMKLPNAPPLSQPEDILPGTFCNGTVENNCQDKFCYCTHMLSVKKGSLIELILVDRGAVYFANHPFHLHGHIFAVLGMERLGEETTLEKVKELEISGKLVRNFDRPPLKDSVTVPDGGYTVLRYFATNPGFWLFHCHIVFHMEVGMGLIFHVGEAKHLPPVPTGFPRCGSWLPPITPGLSSAISIMLKELDNHEKALHFENLPPVDLNASVKYFPEHDSASNTSQTSLYGSHGYYGTFYKTSRDVDSQQMNQKCASSSSLSTVIWKMLLFISTFLSYAFP